MGGIDVKDAWYIGKFICLPTQCVLLWLREGVGREGERGSLLEGSCKPFVLQVSIQGLRSELTLQSHKRLPNFTCFDCSLPPPQKKRVYTREGIRP